MTPAEIQSLEKFIQYQEDTIDQQSELIMNLYERIAKLQDKLHVELK